MERNSFHNSTCPSTCLQSGIPIHYGFPSWRYKMNKEIAIETLNRRLKEVVDKFNALKNCGMDEEILKIYLQNKTKLPRRDIDKMLKHMEEFYDRLIKEELIKNLEK